MSAALHSLMRDTPQTRIRSPFWADLITFLAIGGAGAFSFVLLASAMIWLDTGFADWIVNTVCYGVLILPVYLLHRRYSFRSDASHRQALPRYVAVQGMALVLAALFSYLIHGAMTVPTLVASIMVITLTSGVNFMVLRGWAFARAQWGTVVPA